MTGYPIPRALHSVAWVLIAAMSVACSVQVGPPERAGAAVQQAQSQLHFRIRLPGCIPANVVPTPFRVAIENDPSNGFESVDIEYAFRVRPAQVPGNAASAIAIMESRNKGGENVLFMSGQHKILDQHEVVVTGQLVSPGMEWIQNQTRFQISSVLSWNDTLEVYHSMVTGSPQCQLPSER